MGYTGEYMTLCRSFDFKHCSAVIVTGSGPNVFGHALLNTGGVSGFYFHINETNSRPRIMDTKGFQRYLKENNKKELWRWRVFIPNPERCNRKLEEYLLQVFPYHLTKRNCAHFVVEILNAGGADIELLTPAPKLEIFE